MNKLEIACFNLESALLAQKGGADRIELCDGFPLGGITPGYEVFGTVKKKIIIDLFVMIRPRGGDFVYSEAEFLQMKKDIGYFKEAGADGLVFGILKRDGSVDLERNRELVNLAAPLPCSFHRAFDVNQDLGKNLEDVIDCGFSTILTSGQTGSAMEGLQNLSELVRMSEGRVTIMPGGAVRSSNIHTLKEKVRTTYYHSSAIVSGDVADLAEVKLLKAKLA